MITWIPKRGGVGGRSGKCKVRVSLDTKHDNPCIRLRISAEVMKSFRWVIGDKIVPSFEFADRILTLSRTPGNGYTLSSFGSRKDQSGKMEGCQVRWSITKEQAAEIFGDKTAFDIDDLIDNGGTIKVKL